jgi:ribosomal protein L37AE/L43A
VFLEDIMARFAGGRRRGEKKEFQWWECPFCKEKVTKRKSRRILWQDNKPTRCCKKHVIKAAGVTP